MEPKSFIFAPIFSPSSQFVVRPVFYHIFITNSSENVFCTVIQNLFFVNYSVFYHMNSMSPFLVSRQFAEKVRKVIHYFSMLNLYKIQHFLTILHPFFVFEFRHPFLYEKWPLLGAILAPWAPQGPPFLVKMGWGRLAFCSLFPKCVRRSPSGRPKRPKGSPKGRPGTP